MTKSCLNGIVKHAWINFWGFPNEHFHLVENLCNLSTGYISPQFHLVFDDLFHTVVRTKEDDNALNDICNYLFDLNMYWYDED